MSRTRASDDSCSPPHLLLRAAVPLGAGLLLGVAALLLLGSTGRTVTELAHDGAFFLLGLLVALAVAGVRVRVRGGSRRSQETDRRGTVSGARRSGADREAPGFDQVELLATLSHEIRTPVQAIMGVSELLMTGRLDPVQRQQVAHLRRSASLIRCLADDVLDRATVDAGSLVAERQPFELADVLADAVELLRLEADAKGVRLETEIDPGCPDWVRGDGPRLRQVLVNLLSNAVKHTEAGVVTLEVCRAAAPDEPGRLYFQVTDTGTGIPASELQLIFEPHHRVARPNRLSPGGNGLGLWISRSLVRAMGGEIVATSQEGVGSVFGFEIVLPAEQPSAEARAALRGMRVLVVDSQPERTERCAAQLRRWGAVVDTTPGAPWSRAAVDVVVLREDHPDALAALGAEPQAPAGRRPPLLLVTASPHAVREGSLTGADLLVGPSTAGRRLRALLTSVRPTAPAATTPSGPARPALRVLLAEDDPLSRTVCELLVRQLGHHVDGVGDGVEAVRAASSGSYDLVLMDSQLPGLDGTDATRAIRTSGPAGRQVPIVALTGAVAAHEREAYVAAGMDGLLEKPFGKAQLARLLAQVADRRDVRSRLTGTALTGTAVEDDAWSLPLVA